MTRVKYCDHSLGYGSQFQPTDVISASISNISAYAISLTIDSISSGSTSAGAISVHTTSRGFSTASLASIAVVSQNIAIKHAITFLIFILFYFLCMKADLKIRVCNQFRQSVKLQALLTRNSATVHVILPRTYLEQSPIRTCIKRLTRRLV